MSYNKIVGRKIFSSQQSLVIDLNVETRGDLKVSPNSF